MTAASPQARPVVSNFILFQAGWFACVLGAAYAMPWLGVILALVIVAVHLARSARPGQEMQLLLLVLVIGTLWDSLLVQLGWIGYEQGLISSAMAPYWISALWVLFATTLNLSLRWMQGRWVVAIISGGVAGPLAYFAGHRLGALSFIDTSAAITALALGWAILMPMMLVLARRFDGYAVSMQEVRVS